MSRDLLVVRGGGRLCAIRVEHVAETMRPLRCEPLPDVPAFVRGVSVIRGRPVPVVDLGRLLGASDHASASRLVVVKIDATRRVALLVDEVLGIRPELSLPAGDLPSLLAGAGAEIIEALTRLDDQLLTVLRAGRLVPDTIWKQLAEPTS
jgi:purine-binding chemotaxis protein CheW